MALSYYLRKHNVDIADVKNGAVSFVEKIELDPVNTDFHIVLKMKRYFRLYMQC